MKYNSRLIGDRQAQHHQSKGTPKFEPHGMAEPHSVMLEYRLPCGRIVRLAECYVSLSALGYLAGSKDAIRADIIKRLPERARSQFPGSTGLLIRPFPEGELPTYTFMVALTCNQPVSDPSSDFSSLIVCWLGDDIEQMSLGGLIGREICSVEWDKHAVDGWS